MIWTNIIFYGCLFQSLCVSIELDISKVCNGNIFLWSQDLYWNWWRAFVSTIAAVSWVETAMNIHKVSPSKVEMNIICDKSQRVWAKKKLLNIFVLPAWPVEKKLLVVHNTDIAWLGISYTGRPARAYFLWVQVSISQILSTVFVQTR